jgi:hypothetical protein
VQLKLHLFHDVSIWGNIVQLILHLFLLDQICVVPKNIAPEPPLQAEGSGLFMVASYNIQSSCNGELESA